MPRITVTVALLALALLPSSVVAQKQLQKSKQKPATTTLPTLLSTYLADSGVKTRGLSWGTGGDLPVTWATTKPATPPYTVGPGITLQHEGTIQVQASDTSVVEVSLRVYGNDTGIQRFVAFWDMGVLGGVQAEDQLTAAGWTLKPLKCSRDTEGYSFGNLLYAAKAPGKTASGLQEGWNCAHDGCLLSMTIYYRKADVEQFDCAGA